MGSPRPGIGFLEYCHGTGSKNLSPRPTGFPLLLLRSVLLLLNLEYRPDPGRADLAGPRIVPGPFRGSPANQPVPVRTFSHEISVDEGICRCVGLQKQWPLLIGLISGRPVNRSAIVNGHRTGWTARVDGIFKVELSQVLLADAADPIIPLILVKKIQMMAAGNEAHVAHFRRDIFEKNPQGQRGVVGVWPELYVLMPFDLFPTSGSLEIQLAVMEFYIRANQVFHHIHQHRITGEFDSLMDRLRSTNSSLTCRSRSSQSSSMRA
jgi:hypothetical protein